MESNISSLFMNPTIIAVICTLVTNFLIAFLNNTYQNKRDKINQIRDIYSGCIKNLSTVLTLYFDIEENKDKIEESLVEAKKYLALLLIYTKSRKEFNEIQKDIYLFTIGEYKEVIEEANKKGLKLSVRYASIQEASIRDIRLASDIILKKILETAPKDKRL